MKRVSVKKRKVVLLTIAALVFVLIVAVSLIFSPTTNKSKVSETSIFDSLSNLETVGALITGNNDSHADNKDANNDNNLRLVSSYGNDNSMQNYSNIDSNDGVSTYTNHEDDHVHVWSPYYNSRQVQVGTRYVVDQAAVYKSVTCCNVCGVKDVVYGVHQCNDGCFSSHTERILVQQEIGHYEPVYNSEQYIEYYYCSECGTKK